jgi:hypothetical protein
MGRPEMPLDAVMVRVLLPALEAHHGLCLLLDLLLGVQSFLRPALNYRVDKGKRRLMPMNFG